MTEVVATQPKLVSLTGYDPRLDGADCAHCPMARWGAVEGWNPVKPQRVANPRLALIGEFPALNEINDNVPFSPNGKAGKELNRALKIAGIARSNCDIDNVVACRAPRDDYAMIERRLRKDREAGRSPEWEKHPSVHCAGRLHLTLMRNTNVVPMGAVPFSHVVGRETGIQARRGGPMVILPSGVEKRSTWVNPSIPHPTRVLPTISPAFVARSRKNRYAFEIDLGRANRYFFGRLNWTDAPIKVATSVKDVFDFLHGKESPYWTYDTETTFDGPHRATLRSIQFARGTPATRVGQPDDVESLVVLFKNVETNESWWNQHDFWAIWKIIRDAFVDSRRWWGWNSGYFDRMIIERHFGVTPTPHDDGIMLHHRAWSELSHALSFAASTLLDAPVWKIDHEDNKGAEAESLEDFCFYGGTDAIATHRLRPALEAEVAAKEQNAPCPARPSVTLRQLDAAMQEACVGMARIGLKIDKTRRDALTLETEERLHKRRRAAIKAANDAGYKGKLITSGARGAKVHYADEFNPGSVDQTKRLLFDVLGLSSLAETDTGEPSTGDGVLREYLMDPNLPMQMKDYIRPLRAFRETDKQLGTFLRPLRLRSEGGVVDDDGRLRVTWSAHTPVTGRFSSSDPMNVMNWPKFLRELVVPEDGNIFVCADQDALEGRIAAAHWNLKQYLEAFNTPGVDVHQITMLLAFGERIWSMKGAPPVGSYRKKEWTNPDGSKGEIGGEFDELRTLCKRYFYGKIYGASDPVVYELLREAEDDAGNFLYATLTMGKVESISREFLVALPELPRGWDSEIGFFRTHGYTYERITGRRRYFLDGEGDGNEIRNFFDQSAAAGLMNLAMLDMMEALPPFAFGRGTGVIQQNHDSLLLEVPIEKEDWAKRTLKAAMSQHYPDIYAVPFIGKPKSGYSWKKVA